MFRRIWTTRQKSHTHTFTYVAHMCTCGIHMCTASTQLHMERLLWNIVGSPQTLAMQKFINKTAADRPTKQPCRLGKEVDCRSQTQLDACVGSQTVSRAERVMLFTVTSDGNLSLLRAKYLHSAAGQTRLFTGILEVSLMANSTDTTRRGTQTRRQSPAHWLLGGTRMWLKPTVARQTVLSGPVSSWPSRVD